MHAPPPTADPRLPLADAEAEARGRVLREARALELRARRLVQGPAGGAYRSIYRGAGIEFAEARPYLPGDDVRRIDWNVTARAGEPWVKEYVEERELTVMVAVDLSASTAAGPVAAGGRRAAAAVTSLVALAAALHHDRAGLLLFTDRVEHTVPPRHTTRHAMRLVHDVLTHRPAGRGTSVGVACRALQATLRRRAVVFLVTDGIDADYAQPLRALARRHDVTVLTLDDATAGDLPPAGLVQLHDAEGGGAVLVDARDRRVRAAVARAAAARRQAIADACTAAGVDRVSIPTGGADPLAPLLGHLRARSRAGTRRRR